MLILGIESSCDETAAAVVRDGREIVSDVVSTQIDMHKVYGGVVPEIASRKHIETICPLVSAALEKAGISLAEVDAVAVTFAPGLIGALLVGVNFAKGLAYAAGKPLVPVHHHRGHVAANYLAFSSLEPPFLALIASGGHTLIVGVDRFTSYRVIGSTRDDAAGEAFDKISRALGLGYPGGKVIDKLAAGGDSGKYPLPRAKVENHPYDMSFSGLKTAVINLIHTAQQRGQTLDLASLAASFELAVCDEIIPRVISAAKECGYGKVVAAGGVVANSVLREKLTERCAGEELELFLPPLSLCGDNAAMIASQGYYEYLNAGVTGMELNAFATLSADYTEIPAI